MSDGKDVLEKRFFDGDFSLKEGRVVVGIAAPYLSPGQGPKGKEIIAPGAFGPVEKLAKFNLTVNHNPMAPIASNLMFEDTENGLEVRAEIIETTRGRDALLELKAEPPILRGFSVEFLCQAEHREKGYRVIDQALLKGLSVVYNPAFEEAKVKELRAEQSRELTVLQRNLISYA